jgi:hypothetical protein
MNPLNLITDRYDRTARLYPALLPAAPVVAAAIALLSAKLSALQTLGTVLLGCGGAFLLTQLARDAGKKKEKQLFVNWGGMPSMSIFRHRDCRLNSVTKARCHQKLARLVKGAKAPSTELETADPDSADAIYTGWSDYLRVSTRDTKKFPLVFEENINYGYRRNVWGLRPLGIATSLASCVACGIRLYLMYKSTGTLDRASMLAGAFALVLLLLWLFRFTPYWVRVAADTYAERLVECAETVGSKNTVARDTRKR